MKSGSTILNLAPSRLSVSVNQGVENIHRRDRSKVDFAQIPSFSERKIPMVDKSIPLAPVLNGYLMHRPALSLANYRLLGVFNWVCENNKSDLLPYHNTHHMAYVAWMASELMTSSGEPYSEEDVKAVLVAGIFHDFDHTGGRTKDRVNIERAINGYHLAKETLDMSDLDDAVVEGLIAVTEHPFIREPKTLGEKCIRDADALYPILINDPDVILSRLHAEMEVHVGRKVTAEEMVDGYLDFTKTITFFTVVGKTFFDNYADIYIDNLKAAQNRNKN